MARDLLLADRAIQDIRQILTTTEQLFGERAGLRYEALIQRGMTALLNGETDSRLSEFLGLPEGVIAWHLSRSRRSSTGAIEVRKPRHYLVYRMTDTAVELLRVLHDRNDVSNTFATDEHDDPETLS